ncbi:MAG: homogentisate 1,2-dioxygenase [Myxococcaceae bacterium]
MSANERTSAKAGAPGVLAGFGSELSSEAEPGALPRHQNSPRRVPMGLFAEQLSATPFLVPRAQNRRSWLYRIRPSTEQSYFRPLPHPGVSAWGSHLAPNSLGWKPRPLPMTPTDFIDGLITVAIGGSAADQAGLAIHSYVTNVAMVHKAICSADGDSVLLSDEGEVLVRTEFGRFRIGPGDLLLIPRGVRFSVDPLGGASRRGWWIEAFGSGFELPNRGVVGANGLAEPRHFVACEAEYEDAEGEWMIIQKYGGSLYAAESTHSPFDVVAWHGNAVPLVYDLSRFSPVGAVAFDHPDPSIFTVLTAPTGLPGRNVCDLAVFPARWDAAMHTFRRPYYHRQAATEWNAILTGHTSNRVYSRGGSFLTPPMTPHGITPDALERELSGKDDEKPRFIAESAMWFQLETHFLMSVTDAWRESAFRDADFHSVARGARVRFNKPGRGDRHAAETIVVKP